MLNIRIKTLLYIEFLIVMVVILFTNLFYIISYDTITTKRADEYFSTIFSLLENRIVMLTDSFERVTQEIAYNRTVHRYMTATTPEEREQIGPFINNILMKVVLSTASDMRPGSLVEAACIIDNSGNMLSTLQNGLAETGIIMENIIHEYKLSEINYREPFYTRTYYLSQYAGLPYAPQYYAYIQPVKSLDSNELYSEHLGYSIYLCNSSVVQSYLTDVDLPSNAILMLSNYDNSVICCTNPDMVGMSIYSIFEEPTQVYPHDMTSIRYNGSQFLSRLTAFQNTEWKMLLLVPIKDLRQDMQLVQSKSLMIGIISISILIFISLGVNHSISKQIGYLISGMRCIGSDTSDYRFDASLKSEIGVIAKVINSMLDEIEKQTADIMTSREKLYLSDMLQKRTELYALQNQINPHFLYNTLECVRSIAIYYKVDDIASIASSMAAIFRYCIKSDRYVAIRDELDCIKQYFSIINIRFAGRISLILDVHESAMQKKIPKMILQPLLENAVYHGLEQISRPGIVKVCINQPRSSYMDITISDDGEGMSDQHLQKISDYLNDTSITQDWLGNQSIGLVNIQSRLKMNYGAEYGIEISSKKKFGTIIRVRIPNQDFEADIC